jgi:hypothetical protein
MGAQHTPGPWELKPPEEGVPYRRIRGTRLGARFKIANVQAPQIFTAYDPLQVSEDNESEANARLIAAAPELLEALMRCRFDSLNMSLADLEFCRAAIAKATGSTA